MIWSSIISLLLNMLWILMNLLPSVSSDQQDMLDAAVNSANNLKAFIGSFNWIFPIDDLFFVLRFIVLTGFALWTFRFFRWLASNLSASFFK